MLVEYKGESIRDGTWSVQEYAAEELFEDGELNKIQAGLKLLRLWYEDRIVLIAKED